jgi:protein-L-isoaspartate(D-aspartate) O-methyltransferase
MMFLLRRQYVAVFGGLAVIAGIVIWQGRLAMRGKTDSKDDSPRVTSQAAGPEEVESTGGSAPQANDQSTPPQEPGTADSPAATEDPRYVALRRDMVDTQIRARGIKDERVLEAMRRVPRHLFVPLSQRDAAYTDGPRPIGQGQTISQPYMVAKMTELAKAGPSSKALDVGTGSGYQAAILAEICQHVHSIEIIESLAEQAEQRLSDLGYQNITVRCGDGYRGWPDSAPFDLIIVAAAPDHIPQPLIQQLAEGGRLVIPVGRHPYFQELIVVEKGPGDRTRQWTVVPVAFVPMTGEAQRRGRE